MRGVVIGFEPSGLKESLSALKTLSEALGKEIKCTAVVVSESHINVKGFEEIHMIKGDSLYKVIQIILDHISNMNPDVVVGVNGKDSVDIISRLAFRMGRFMVSDVSNILKLDREIYLARSILGARALAYYKYVDGVFFTITKGKFQPIEIDLEPKKVEVPVEETFFKVIGKEEKAKGAVNIESADVVIGVGRGFRNKEDISIAMELAKLLGGEIGCSRPIAADLRWLGEDRWIGISGKKIRPKLYMPIGISGAPQHIMAANDSRMIVAINKDRNAPIFNYSDYGVVADLYKFLPELIKALKEEFKK